MKKKLEDELRNNIITPNENEDSELSLNELDDVSGGLIDDGLRAAKATARIRSIYSMPANSYSMLNARQDELDPEDPTGNDAFNK
ncbi:hypothetical protein [Ruminococcus sp.]|uniref:hypothetical protein n=1 Tax=Ruminococcus sp. TaxID=41978 RepID=UPI0025D19F3C|nr:hypothetical protein [Ruminococcus sp.]MBQ8966925.1 hypothetical protein [Ruminococcus sp.]